MTRTPSSIASDPHGDRARGDPAQASIRDRLRVVCRGFTYGEIAACTGVSEESVRRYRLSGRPSALFVARLCAAFDLSADWLLLGREGPLARGSDVASGVDATLGVVERHLSTLKSELSEVKLMPQNAESKQGPPMTDSMTRPIRLVLGPADGRAIRPERTLEDEIRVRLVPPENQAAIVDAMHPAPEGEVVLVYRRVLPTVYCWVRGEGE